MGKWYKGESGNLAGRPRNELRDKTLQQLLEGAAEHVSITGSDGTKIAPFEATIEGLYRRAIDGEIQATRYILQLWERFLPKSKPESAPVDVRIVEMPLTQDIVDSWHAQGFFPDDTPTLISDISENDLNAAYRRSQKKPQ